MKEKINHLPLGILALLIFFVLDSFNFHFLSNQVYAYEKNDDEPYLKSIYLSEGNDLDFKQDKFEYAVDVLDVDEKIYIKAKPDDDDYTVQINGTKLKEDEKYKYETNLVEGKNKFVIRVTNGGNDKYTEYTVFVYRGGKEAVYLKDLRVDENKIGFEKKGSNYNIELDDDTSSADINITPEDDSYSVYVKDSNSANGDYTKINYNYPVTLNFSKSVGKYNIKIKLCDNDTDRFKEYNLSFFIGISVSPNPLDEIEKIKKPNSWVIVNGRWRYNNYKGDYIKDVWFYDTNYNGCYYLNSKGYMETGWLNLGDYMYYLGTDGARKTGWCDIDDDWYYFDVAGKMQTGWVQVDNIWYYLDDDGKLVCGRWITENDENYYLKEDGAMEIGWFKIEDEWYYFNTDGTMKSGEWLRYNDNWYYLNKSGTMRTGWLHKDGEYYYLETDGTMRKSPLLYNGYLYYFNNDGSVNFN